MSLFHFAPRLLVTNTNIYGSHWFCFIFYLSSITLTHSGVVRLSGLWKSLRINTSNVVEKRSSVKTQRASFTSANNLKVFMAISHRHIRSCVLKHSCTSFFVPIRTQMCSVGWFFSGKSFYRTAAFGLNMQDSPSDRKNMANALAPVCEGRVSSGTGRVRVWRDARTTLWLHFWIHAGRKTFQLHFTDNQKYVLLKMSRMLPFHPL